MLYLVISSLFSIIIANLLKYHSKKNISFLSLFLGNYLLAGLFAFISGATLLHIHPMSFIPWSILIGILYIFCFILYKTNIIHNGVSLSVSVMRISLIIPTILSVIFFKEHINLYTGSAIVLILLIIILLSKRHSRVRIFLLVILFLATGFSDFILKIKDSFLVVNNTTFLFYMFSSALVSTIILMVLKKEKLSLNSLYHGLILGIPNYLTTLFFLKSLTQLPAVVSYPLNSSIIIIGSFITDRYLWRNKFTLEQVLLYSGLIFCIILLNIGLYIN